MRQTQFKRLLRNPQKKGARADVGTLKPLEGSGTRADGKESSGALGPSNIASAETNIEVLDAAEPSPDADQPKGVVPESADGREPVGSSGQSGNGAEAKRSGPEIFTDKSVCRMLGIRRRILAAARTARARGVAWDSIGEEVGMTRAWITEYALKNGIVPDFFGTQLEPVTGRYVSVQLVGTTPNKCIVQAEITATGRREFVRTRNIDVHPLGFMEVFDCLRIDAAGDNHLEWVAGPNEAKY